MSEKKIAIIPARGGSKRIPGKNMKFFLGKPIISYSIEIALKSKLFDEVMVSTDDQNIAKIALNAGAKIPFLRSAINSDDFATTIDVVNEVLNNYKIQFNRKFKYCCCIYPTAPLIDIHHLFEGLQLLRTNNLNSVFPIVSFGYPIWKGMEILSDGKTKMLWTQYQNARTQDLKKAYHDAGQWYWLNAFKITDSLFTENSGSIIIPEEMVQDIDTISDWKIAEMKYKLLYES